MVKNGMDRKTENGVKCLFCLFGLLVLALPAQGASFDCGKASTKVEKLICSDGGLSELDEHMASAYADATKKFPAPDALKLRQKQWLKRRNACVQDDQKGDSQQANDEYISRCLKESYEQRLNEVTILTSVELPCPELPIIKSESEKTQCVKRWLAKHPLELSRKSISADGQKLCDNLYQALFSGSPEVHYIEPMLRTEDPMHPELAHYRDCGNVQPEGLGQDYEGINDETAHGFRLYRLNLGSDPQKGPAEYLYEEENGMGVQKVDTNYVRVEFSSNNCYVKDLVGVTPQEPRKPIQNTDWGLNSIISYRGHYYILDLDGHISLRATAFDSAKQSFSVYQCSWLIPDRLLNN